MASPARFQFGTPPEEQWEFFGDTESEELFRGAIARLEEIGGERIEFDYSPFRECAELLYGGPWVAERDAAVGDFIRANSDSIHPVVRTIILGGGSHSAVDTFRAMYRLEDLRVRTRPVWETVDLLLLPTTGTIFRADEVLADPITTNTKLGYYTNFMNLLDLCGVALPAGERRNGTPFGITLVGPAFFDDFILALGARYVGRSSYSSAQNHPDRVRLAVVGAHLSEQPLNHQLTGRGARFLTTTRTLDSYKLYALAGTTPPKPGLVRVGSGGASIEVEVWELSAAAFGSFVSEVPPPLAIGTLELEDGSSVKGFVCEPRALDGALDITSFGGWRGYLRDRTSR
jgi:allophanate hydrolase